MNQEIRLYPAFDDMVNGCEHTPKDDHGRRAVRMVWRAVDGGFGVEWDLHTNWMLPETYEKGQTIYGGPIDWGARLGFGPSVIDMHSPEPTYEGQERRNSKCEVTDLDHCYSDAAYSVGETFEEILVREGSEKVWEKLADWVEGMKADAESVKTANS